MKVAIKDISQIRMDRFNDLRSEFKERHDDEALGRGELNRFGEFVGISPRYLSHIINGRKNIGAESARKMEAAFKKPTNWMDSPDEAPVEGGEEIVRRLAIKAYRKDPIATHEALLSIVMGDL